MSHQSNRAEARRQCDLGVCRRVIGQDWPIVMLDQYVIVAMVERMRGGEEITFIVFTNEPVDQVFIIIEPPSTPLTGGGLVVGAMAVETFGWGWEADQPVNNWYRMQGRHTKLSPLLLAGLGYVPSGRMGASATVRIRKAPNWRLDDACVLLPSPGNRGAQWAAINAVYLAPPNTMLWRKNRYRQDDREIGTPVGVAWLDEDEHETSFRLKLDRSE
ncbi:unnamed protein product [Protopolystoma xenopodis]|uniref:Uncharacterized protein n=1 Tax=Protopolystoma xenopodis TaxID=117903 RepID=A0A448XI40_9PLAT|nr:unnamed protein product [Protopolystoma xenopodis]